MGCAPLTTKSREFCASNKVDLNFSRWIFFDVAIERHLIGTVFQIQGALNDQMEIIKPNDRTRVIHIYILADLNLGANATIVNPVLTKVDHRAVATHYPASFKNYNTVTSKPRVGLKINRPQCLNRAHSFPLFCVYASCKYFQDKLEFTLLSLILRFHKCLAELHGL